MKHSESIAAIAEALAAAQAEYVPVKKTKEATVKGTTKQGKAYEYTYMYADLADILSMLLPRLSKQGIALSQPNVLVDGKLRVVTYLLHKTGEWMHSDGIEMSEEGDPQQFGIESTYFRRYDVASFTGVAPDEDTDARGAGNRTKRTTPAQAMEGARSHQENPLRAPASSQGNQSSNQQPPASQQATQAHGAPTERVPPNGMIATIKTVKYFPAQEKPKLNAMVNVALAEPLIGNNQGKEWKCEFAGCFHGNLLQLIQDSVGKECHFIIKERDRKLNVSDEWPTHFIDIEDVASITNTTTGEYLEYIGGKPVLQGDAQ